MRLCANALWVLPAAMLCLGGCGRGERISISGPPRGSLQAARVGNVVIVQVGLADVPADVKLMTLGLKLGDGTAVYPKTIRMLNDPPRDLAAAPRVDFAFDGDGPRRRGAAEPGLWVRVTFELEPPRSADGSTFSLVLGDSETVAGCRMGITTSIFTRDGSPSLFGCILPEERLEEGSFLPLPRIRPQAPTVSFFFRELPDGRRKGELVKIVPALAMAPDAGGGSTAVALVRRSAKRRG